VLKCLFQGNFKRFEHTITFQRGFYMYISSFIIFRDLNLAPYVVEVLPWHENLYEYALEAVVVSAKLWN